MMTANEIQRHELLCANARAEGAKAGYAFGKAEGRQEAFVCGVVVGAVATLFLAAIIHTVTL